MILLTILWLLGQVDQGDCSDKSPGLSRCVTYEGAPPHVRCHAECYYGWKPDAGTKPATVKAEAASNDACLYELKRQATNNCHP